MRLEIVIVIETDDFDESERCFDYLWDKACKYWNVKEGHIKKVVKK